uniref:Activin types I and II receptor domain-containing protein n=1 Tax=Wuchereria bancrofti TaxID=6293 RepID=A0AAF5Q3E8_WUCBA
MMYRLFLAISLLFIENIGEPTGDRLHECYNCPGSSPNCNDVCEGRYCYKAEFIADGYTTVKRGCLNETDGGIQIGLCEETPSNLPGSDLRAVERMCICTTDRCNLASTHSAFINLFVVVIASFIFYNL